VRGTYAFGEDRRNFLLILSVGGSFALVVDRHWRHEPKGDRADRLRRSDGAVRVGATF
jgi:hypothetical protein